MNSYGKHFCFLWDHVTVALNLSSFPGIQKPLDQYGPAIAATDSAPAKDAEDDDDDDFDLFGSDDEEAVCVVSVWLSGPNCVKYI